MGVLKIGALYRDTRKFSEREAARAARLGASGRGVRGRLDAVHRPHPRRHHRARGDERRLEERAHPLGLLRRGARRCPSSASGLLMNAFLGFYSRFRRHLHKVEVASGVLLIVIGAAGRLQQPDVGRRVRLALPAQRREPRQAGCAGRPRPEPAGGPGRAGGCVQRRRRARARRRADDDRRQASEALRAARAGRAPQLLGDVVRALPLGDTEPQRDGARPLGARLQSPRRHDERLGRARRASTRRT